jgi:hypothetical protein
MWVAPVLLAAIGVFLAKAGLNQKSTLESGEPATARVVDVEIRNRADVTYGHIDLRIPESASDSSDVRLPLPLSLLMGISSEETLDVRLVPDSDQPVMIEKIAHPQWRMSLIHASMCLVGALLLSWGVLAWNRYLDKS